jgi:large subunit ribosomal protein L1
MNEETLKKVSTFIDENKGKRKFLQSVELAINFRGIDFAKTDNRLNLSVPLPAGRGKQSSLAVFTDDQSMTSKANSMGL